ncbi:hypothetical protein NESM_000219700 [Novymonas esmeraldas]|uniref:Uncharacterized protein n=1 Tax=Novymonas esmeraldas TaxID=1808958 RepID=A0AAW0F5V4_9TRYP
MNAGVRWHETPVSLHISTTAAAGASPSAPDDAGCRLAPSLPLPAAAAQHILFFGVRGEPVHAAPLRVTVEATTSSPAGTSAPDCAADATVAPVVPSSPPSPTVPSGVVFPSAAAAVAVEAVEEWTDAVDEEAAAFFDED